MKKFFFIAVCLVAASVSPVLAQTTAPVVAVVSIQYAADGIEAGHLQINRAGKIEYKDVSMGIFNRPASAGQILTARANVLREIVTQLYQEGYVLKASLGHQNIDELIFIKEK